MPFDSRPPKTSSGESTVSAEQRGATIPSREAPPTSTTLLRRGENVAKTSLARKSVWSGYEMTPLGWTMNGAVARVLSLPDYPRPGAWRGASVAVAESRGSWPRRSRDGADRAAGGAIPCAKILWGYRCRRHWCHIHTHVSSGSTSPAPRLKVR